MTYETLIENAIQNHMAMYGSSRAEAEATVNGGNRTSQRGPEAIDTSISDADMEDYFGSPSIAQYDTDVDDPTSSVVEEKRVTKDENGRTVETTIKSPNNTPDALAKKALEEQQSAQETNPQDSQVPSSIFDGPIPGFSIDPSALEPQGPSGRSGYIPPPREMDIEPPSIFEGSAGGPTGRGGLGGNVSMPAPDVQASGMGEGTPISTAQEAEDIINNDAPEIIPWINEFEQAVKEFDENEALVAAERITDKAIETGLDKVKPRAFKALTVALTSMLFGVDAVDAVESGARVVAQDYAEEAAASAAQASAVADQQKFLFESGVKSDLKIREERDKAGLTSSSDTTKGNYAALKDMATHFEGINPDLKESLGMTDIMGPLQEAHAEMTRIYGQLNLKDSAVGSAYRKGVQGFLEEVKFNPGTTETMLSFMKDQIARKELTDYKGSITTGDLTNKNSVESKESRKMISDIFTKIQALAGKIDPATQSKIGEKGAMSAFKEAFKEHNATQEGQAKQAEAKAAGVTPFIWFAANFNG